MNAPDIRESIRRAGLRQIDFVRLVASLTGQDLKKSNPSKALVSSWCAGRHAAPATAHAACALFGMLDRQARRRLLQSINAPTPAPGYRWIFVHTGNDEAGEDHRAVPATLSEMTDVLIMGLKSGRFANWPALYLKERGFTESEIREHADAALLAARATFTDTKGAPLCPAPETSR